MKLNFQLTQSKKMELKKKSIKKKNTKKQIESIWVMSRPE